MGFMESMLSVFRTFGIDILFKTLLHNPDFSDLFHSPFYGVRYLESS
jgi:hypothetical protein